MGAAVGAAVWRGAWAARGSGGALHSLEAGLQTGEETRLERCNVGLERKAAIKFHDEEQSHWLLRMQRKWGAATESAVWRC